MPPRILIADDHPELIWVDVSADEYYGEMRNMEPGTEPARSPRLAGQRAPLDRPVEPAKHCRTPPPKGSRAY